MNRRNFIKSTAILAATTGITKQMPAANSVSVTDTNEKNDESKLINSAPMLQNYAETSIGIAFSVTAMANGFVIYGLKPDLSDGKKVYCGGLRLTDMNDKVMQIRLTGLRRATKYYYQIGADRIHYGGGYDMKILGTETCPTIYSFSTAGQNAKAHFCVINDTHRDWESFEPVINKVAALAPSCVIWNGDACNTEETIEAQKEIFLYPKIKQTDYAANTPYLFCPGNHDSRGLANRHLERVWMYRQPEERHSRDWDLGRNFAVRMGDVALIGLDTAEDKQDTNPLFAGLFASNPYRRAQVNWLRDALNRPDIVSAPYIVALCHIPLFDSDPTHNPGDIEPDDKNPAYSADYAYWQRYCAKLWTPLLEEVGCQLIICAHMHLYRYDAPDENRTWAQIVGGGPDIKDNKPDRFPTVIEGKVNNGQLQIRVHNIKTNKIQQEFAFKPRKTQ